MKVRLDTLRPGDWFKFEGIAYIKVRFPNANASCPGLGKFALIPEDHMVSVPPFSFEDGEEVSTAETMAEMRASQFSLDAPD